MTSTWPWRLSHYCHASLPREFDAVIHIDVMTALQPREPGWLGGEEFPETYPSSL